MENAKRKIRSVFGEVRRTKEILTAEVVLLWVMAHPAMEAAEDPMGAADEPERPALEGGPLEKFKKAFLDYLDWIDLYRGCIPPCAEEAVVGCAVISYQTIVVMGSQSIDRMLEHHKPSHAQGQAVLRAVMRVSAGTVVVADGDNPGPVPFMGIDIAAPLGDWGHIQLSTPAYRVPDTPRLAGIRGRAAVFMDEQLEKYPRPIRFAPSIADFGCMTAGDCDRIDLFGDRDDVDPEPDI